MKQLMILIAAFTLYAACKKEKPTSHTTVSGQVVNEYDGRPVPFATVFLITEERGCLGNMGCAKQVMTAIADADGKYSFVFDWVNDNFYSVDANGSEWYKHFIPMVSIDNKGKANKVNIKMRPFGLTPLRLKNVKHNSNYIRISDPGRNFSGDNLDTTIFLLDLVSSSQKYSVTGLVELLGGGDSNFVIPYSVPPPLGTSSDTIKIFY